MTRANSALYTFRAGIKFPKRIPSQNPRQCLPDVNNSSRQGFRKPTACSQKCWSNAQLRPAPSLTFGCLDRFCFLCLVSDFFSAWSLFTESAQTVFMAAGSQSPFGPLSSTPSSLFLKSISACIEQYRTVEARLMPLLFLFFWFFFYHSIFIKSQLTQAFKKSLFVFLLLFFDI